MAIKKEKPEGSELCHYHVEALEAVPFTYEVVAPNIEDALKQINKGDVTNCYCSDATKRTFTKVELVEHGD